jgi:hypothetical protein
VSINFSIYKAHWQLSIKLRIVDTVCKTILPVINAKSLKFFDALRVQKKDKKSHTVTFGSENSPLINVTRYRPEYSPFLGPPLPVTGELIEMVQYFSEN